jgi:hypothetical protein
LLDEDVLRTSGSFLMVMVLVITPVPTSSVIRTLIVYVPSAILGARVFRLNPVNVDAAHEARTVHVVPLAE